MKSRAIWITCVSVAVVAALVLFALSTQEIGPRPLTPQEAVGQQWLKAPGAETAFAGDAACRECHAAEFKTHSRSPHARTVKRLGSGEKRSEFLTTGQVEDPQGGVVYTTSSSALEGVIMARTGDKTTQGSPHWVFGSGTQAWSYLGEREGGFLEYRVSYYPPAKTWTFTPGRGPQDPPTEPLGHHYNHLEAAACFGCHSTALIGSKQRLELGRSLLNVGCESCHGAARAHVESAKQLAVKASGASGTLVKPAALKGQAITEKCGACHRLPPNGEARDEVIEAQLARFPGAALVRSRCFKESAGKLTCVTCHNPHQQASREPTSYDRACLSCHTPPRGEPCAKEKTSRCVSCHMPVQQIARRLPLRFHNHWIRPGLADDELLQIGRALAPATASP